MTCQGSTQIHANQAQALSSYIFMNARPGEILVR